MLFWVFSATCYVSRALIPFDLYRFPGNLKEREGGGILVTQTWRTEDLVQMPGPGIPITTTEVSKVFQLMGRKLSSR